MPEFRIEPMPSRSLKSEKVVYYVRSRSTHQLVTKFDTNTKTAEEIEGFQNFTASEKLELQNYLASVKFTIDALGLSAKNNRDYRLVLPDSLQEALVKLYERAKINNINFNPMEAMLRGLLNHISTTDKRLTSGGEPSILKDFNIILKSQDEKENQHKELRKFTKKIFNCLQKLNGGLENYAKTARELYQNETNLNRATLLKYAEGNSKPSQWSISCALTTIGKIEELMTIMPLPLIIQLWITPLRFSGKIQTINQALTVFKQYFISANIADEQLYIEKEMNKAI